MLCEVWLILPIEFFPIINLITRTITSRHLNKMNYPCALKLFSKFLSRSYFLLYICIALIWFVHVIKAYRRKICAWEIWKNGYVIRYSGVCNNCILKLTFTGLFTFCNFIDDYARKIIAYSQNPWKRNCFHR